MDTKIEIINLKIPSNGQKQIESSYEYLESLRLSHWEDIMKIKKTTINSESKNKEISLEKHNFRLENLIKLDKELPFLQDEIEKRLEDLMIEENAENLQLEFEKFKSECETIIQAKQSLILDFSKELEYKHSTYINSLHKFKTDIVNMISLMKKQFTNLRNSMLEIIWNESLHQEKTEKRKGSNYNLINKDKNQNCIEGEFLRDREILINDYHEYILNLINRLESNEEQSGARLSQQENERENENEKEAFKEESKFINKLILMERFFNIVKQEVEDFSYDLKILLEKLEYRVEIREEKIKENKENVKKYTKERNKMKVRISKSLKAYKLIDSRLRMENMNLKIEFIKMTDSFDDLKKKFKHFKSYDEERFMKIYNMNFLESRELAKKVLYAERTIKNQQLGVDFYEKQGNEVSSIETKGFSIEDLQNDDLIEDERAILVVKNVKIDDKNEINQKIISRIRLDKVKTVFQIIIQEAEFLIDMQTIDKYGRLNIEEKLPFYIESLCKALSIKNESDLNQLIDLFEKKSKLTINDNDNFDDAISIDPDKVLDYLKEFYDERKKANKNELIGKASSSSNYNDSTDNVEAFKERMIYLSETVWNEKFSKIISEKTFSVWKSLYKGLSKYHDLLFERKKVIGETRSLYEKNKELKDLLRSYMNKEENHSLKIPPHQTIKIEKINFALSDIGEGSVSQ